MDALLRYEYFAFWWPQNARFLCKKGNFVEIPFLFCICLYLTRECKTSKVYKVFQKPFSIVNRGSIESLCFIVNKWSNLYDSKQNVGWQTHIKYVIYLRGRHYLLKYTEIHVSPLHLQVSRCCISHWQRHAVVPFMLWGPQISRKDNQW